MSNIYVSKISISSQKEEEILEAFYVTERLKQKRINQYKGG